MGKFQGKISTWNAFSSHNWIKIYNSFWISSQTIYWYLIIEILHLLILQSARQVAYSMRKSSLKMVKAVKISRILKFLKFFKSPILCEKWIEQLILSRKHLKFNLEHNFWPISRRLKIRAIGRKHQFWTQFRALTIFKNYFLIE